MSALRDPLSYLHPKERKSDLTEAQQAESLQYVVRIIDGCLGHSARDTYRAYELGSRILGFTFDQHRVIFRDARLYGPEGAVSRHPNVVRIGEAVADVYFATDQDGGLLKIGYSLNLERRISELQRQTGRSLRIVHTKPGFRLSELFWLLQARAAWIGGEWFDLGHALEIPALSFLNSIDGKPPSRALN